MGELSEVGDRLARLGEPATIDRVVAAAGKAATAAVEDAAAADLGGDRSFSRMRSKGSLTAAPTAAAGGVSIEFRPAALWHLAQSGRRGSSPIRPRTKRAVVTPQGPRARSTSAPSRGLGTVDKAVAGAMVAVGPAARAQYRDEIASVVKG